MQLILTNAGLFYSQHGAYPTETNWFASAESFFNPFDRKKFYPTIKSISIGDGKHDEQADYARNLLASQLGERSGIPADLPLKPGYVRCYSVVTHLSRGDVHQFFVQGYDQNAKIISGSYPHTNFVLGYEDGAVFKTKEALRPRNTFALFHQSICWLVPASLSAPYRIMQDWGPVLVFYGLSAVFAFFYLPSPVGSPTRLLFKWLLMINSLLMFVCMIQRVLVH